MLKLQLQIPRAEAGTLRINSAREYVGRVVLLQLHRMGEVAANPKACGLDPDDVTLCIECEVNMALAAEAK